MNQSSAAEQDGFSNRQQLNVLLFVMCSWCTTMDVFLRRDFGHRYLGANAVGGLLLIPFFLILFPGEDALGLYGFWLAYIVMCAVGRWSWLWSRHDYRNQHSYYAGFPRLLTKRFAAYEVKFKNLYEPFIVGAIAVPITPCSPPLGLYLMGGGVCLWIRAFMMEFLAYTRTMDLNDQVIEQEYVADRFRSNRR